MSDAINRHFLPSPDDLPQLTTPDGHPIPFSLLLPMDSDNIAGEYETYAAWLATIGYACAVAEADSSALDKAVSRKHAQLYFHYTRLNADAKPKPTVDAIKSAIELDEDYQHLEDMAAAAALKAAIIKSALKAFTSKQDMIVGIGANARAEMPRMLQRLD
jgi:hypothetical protein